MRAFLENVDNSSRNLKKHNLHKQVIKSFLRQEELTIPEICEEFKWSIPTGTKLVNELIKKKILINKGKRESSGGRRPDIYALNANTGYIIGIEMLIPSLRIAILDLNHSIVYELEDTTFDITNEITAIHHLKKIVPDVIKKSKIPSEKILGVGIGITGRVDSKSGVSHTYLTTENPIASTLSATWKVPVYISNDSYLMALGEKNFGSALGKENVIVTNLSSGLGIGIIANGEMITGKSGFAGEFGHIHVADNNKQCICGKKGCLGTIVGGTALEEIYNNEDLSKRKGSKKLSYKDILQLSKRNDKKADLLINEMGIELGKAFSILLQIFNPELIIVGGSFTQIGEKLIYPIAKGINLFGLPGIVNDCDLQISTLGENAIMLGAYGLVFENVLG